jgi:hypothetical protein
VTPSTLCSIRSSPSTWSLLGAAAEAGDGAGPWQALKGWSYEGLTDPASQFRRYLDSERRAPSDVGWPTVKMETGNPSAVGSPLPLPLGRYETRCCGWRQARQ